MSTVTAIVVLLAACGKGQQAAAPAVADKTRPRAAGRRSSTAHPFPATEYDIYLKSLLQGKPTTELTAEKRTRSWTR